MMLRKIRITLAAVCFVAVTLLLLDFTGATHRWLGWIAKAQFLPAVLALNVVVIVALLLLTLVFGRVYCSVICPLGVMQDGISWLHAKRKKNRFCYSPAKSAIRYTLLVAMVAGAATGIGTIVTLLSPYGTYGAIVSNLLQPIYLWCNNALAAIAEHYGSYTFYSVDVWIKSVPVMVSAVALLAIIGTLAWRGGRIYCNTICPVGTLLGLVARLSWQKVTFNTDKCRNCGLCAKNCKASCIDLKNHKIDYSRCVTCGDCIDKCNFGALSYTHASTKKREPDTDRQPADTTRRAILVGAAIVGADAAMAGLKKVDGGLTVLADRATPARHTTPCPPGALSVANLERRCVGCQLCISKCPNGVLRPSSDPLHLMQPVMDFDRGFCRPECTTCSSVCPSGAIQPITVAQKSSTQIGHAVWRKKYCVALADEVDCGNCARHCPSGAIQMVPSDPADDTSIEIPVVNTEKCIGCGSCEYVCPARPHAAIYVEGHEVHKTL